MSELPVISVSHTIADSDTSWYTVPSVSMDWTQASTSGFSRVGTSTFSPDANENHDKGTVTMSNRRFVQILIVDPDERVPLDNALIYKDEPHLTDLTNQELFFEINIKDFLDVHNKYRATVIDKTVTDREVHLEPIRIRDLKMVVVEIAQF